MDSREEGWRSAADALDRELDRLGLETLPEEARLELAAAAGAGFSAEISGGRLFIERPGLGKPMGAVLWACGFSRRGIPTAAAMMWGGERGAALSIEPEGAELGEEGWPARTESWLRMAEFFAGPEASGAMRRDMERIKALRDARRIGSASAGAKAAEAKRKAL